MSFIVTNGAGLQTTALPEVGLLFTELPPSTRASRFGHGDQVGMHSYYDNNTRSTVYTLDAVFYDVYAELTNGTFSLRVRGL